MQKKNIAIVVSAMNLGGAQRVVSILCDHWIKSGYEVSLISTFTGNKTNHYEVNKSVKLFYLAEYKFTFGNRSLKLIFKLLQLRRIFKELETDVIISFLTRVNIASALATFGMKRKLVICERTWTPFATLNKNFYWFYRQLFANVARIIVQTDQSKNWLYENFSNSRVTVIPNPVSYPLPIQKERSVSPFKLISKNKKIILASGRLHKFKQFDLLLQAFSKIYHLYDNWDLVILGDGDERKSLQSRVNNFGIQARVHMPGSVGNISDWYNASDIFVLSSLVEGFPNVLLEAMAYGLPCISFDCNTGPREMIEHNKNGLLVAPAEKSEGLAAAIKKLIDNPDLRENISSKSRNIRDKFSINNIMNIWDDVLGK